MTRSLSLSTALALALAAVPAHAQIVSGGGSGVTGPFTVPAPSFGQSGIPNYFNIGPQNFGQGLIPNGLGSPQAITGRYTVNPGTGYGGGYYYPGYGYNPGGVFYGGGYYPVNPYYGGYGTPVWSPPYYTGSQMYLPGGTREQGGQETRTSRTERSSTVRASKDPEQAQISRRAEELMAKRPFRSGKVIRISDDGIEVEYQLDGKARKDTFLPKEVFFFRTNGDLATAATQPDVLKAGDRVLVPEPEQRDRSEKESSQPKNGK